MVVKQVSVLIENKSGSVLRAFNVIKDNGIQLIATTVADTEGTGVLRIICSDADKACEAFRSCGFTATIARVFAIELDDEPGMAADLVSRLSDAGIEIMYLYSFLFGGKGIVIFRTGDPDHTARILENNGYRNLSVSVFKRSYI